MLVCAILACGCLAFADDYKQYCPFGGKPQQPSNDTEYKYANTTTIHYGNCESKTTQHEGTQNHYGANANVESSTTNPFKAGVGGDFSRDGEKTTTTTSSSQCNEATIRYICK